MVKRSQSSDPTEHVGFGSDRTYVERHDDHTVSNVVVIRVVLMNRGYPSQSVVTGGVNTGHSVARPAHVDNTSVETPDRVARSSYASHCSLHFFA